MPGHPKPTPKPKDPRKSLAFGNAYTTREWRQQVRRIRRRSGGICEAQVRCNGDPVQGDPHHLSYAPFTGKRRVLVDDSDLIDCCRRCHLWYEEQKANGGDRGRDFLSLADELP